jgi:hypothetical protein
MMPTVDVIVDRDNDVATVKALHALAAREPGVLAVSIAPGSNAQPAVVWAILRALGKRIEQLPQTSFKVLWMDAERWLVAHQIAEMVVLSAHHLGGGTAEELERHVARLRIALILVYNGPARVRPPATTTLTAFLTRPRRPQPPALSRTRRWPRVPRSHPLRLRYDCSQQLSADEFERVDRLLVGSLSTLAAWQWRCGDDVTPRQVRRTLRVISTANDPDQAYIRRCGAQVALLCAGIPVPRTRPLTLQGRPLTDAQLDVIHGYTAPWIAGYVLAELITGLPAALVDLIAGDQITDDAILGCAVPDRAQAVLRALDTHHEAALQGPAGPTYQPPSAKPHSPRSHAEQLFAAAVAWLLNGRAASIPVSDPSAKLRARLDQLRAAGIVERNRGAYRASHLALYSSYRLPAPPIRALTNE